MMPAPDPRMISRLFGAWNLATLFPAARGLRARANVVKGALSYGNGISYARRIRVRNAVMRAFFQITANSAAASCSEKLADRT